MTTDEHKQRHVELHKALDELFADYISHRPQQSTFLDMPFGQLMEWSHQQTQQPTELEDGPSQT